MNKKNVCGKCGHEIEADRLAVLETPICAKCAAEEPGNILHPLDHTKLKPENLTCLAKGFTISVHDHGFVRYIEHMGTDLSIVEAARVSYRSPSKGDEADKKLLNYLWRNKHTSPFEMCKIKFNIKMPIFVMRQYIRHRMQNVNEVSARYTELPAEFFVPESWRRQDTKNKQGSVETDAPIQLEQPLRLCYGINDEEDVFTQDPSTYVRDIYALAYEAYEKLLAAGVAREQARIVLPVGIYTEFYSCWDLSNLLKYFALRDDPHAQGEHQDYARAMKQITAMCFPWVMEIYEESRKNQTTT